MKEPWEIFYDEFRREWKRRIKHDGELTPDGFTDALTIAAEATAYHLTEQLHWRSEDAMEFVLHLAEAIRERGDDPPRDRLRHSYADWLLGRSRT